MLIPWTCATEAQKKKWFLSEAGELHFQISPLPPPHLIITLIPRPEVMLLKPNPKKPM